MRLVRHKCGDVASNVLSKVPCLSEPSWAAAMAFIGLKARAKRLLSVHGHVVGRRRVLICVALVALRLQEGSPDHPRTGRAPHRIERLQSQSQPGSSGHRKDAAIVRTAYFARRVAKTSCPHWQPAVSQCVHFPNMSVLRQHSSLRSLPAPPSWSTGRSFLPSWCIHRRCQGRTRPPAASVPSPDRRAPPVGTSRRSD